MNSNKFPFKVGDKVYYTGDDGWYEDGEILTVTRHSRKNEWTVNGDDCLDLIDVEEEWNNFKLVEQEPPSPQKHIHYDMIVEWAANPSGVVVEYFDNIDMCWKYIEKPAWVSSCQYRFKPEEPERVFPKTTLGIVELYSHVNSDKEVISIASLKAVADAAIKKYILEQEEKK